MSCSRALLAAAIGLLVSCGGGGGGGGADPPGNGGGGGVLASLAIDDPKPFYQHACETPVIQFVIPVDLNGDGRLDFLVHYWCMLPQPWGRAVATPTPDALVALVSRADGSYRVANEEVFGQALYGLGGASRKYARGDINGDGRDDFAFAMNWEDGRSAEDGSTNATQPSVLLSSPSGGYRVVRLGAPDWGHAVDLVRNAEGSVDVLSAGYVRSRQVLRYQAGGFVDVGASYPPGDGWGASVRALNGSVATEYIAGSAYRQDIEPDGSVTAKQGLQLHKRRDGGGWDLAGEHWIPVDFTVDWISWQLTSGTMSVVTVNGQRYFAGSFDEMCEMPALTPGGRKLLVAKVGAARDKQGRAIVPGQTYHEQDARSVNIFVFFEYTDTGLTKVDSPMVDEDIDATINFFDCKDINQDGLPDLVAYAFTRPGFGERTAEGGKPIVYLNNGSGRLVRKDISTLPRHSAGNELQSRMADVNGDGIVDLILFGAGTDMGGGRIEIHLLARRLQ